MTKKTPSQRTKTSSNKQIKIKTQTIQNKIFKKIQKKKIVSECINYMHKIQE